MEIGSIDDMDKPLAGKHEVEEGELENEDEGPGVLVPLELVLDVEAEGEEVGAEEVFDFFHVLI